VSWHRVLLVVGCCAGVVAAGEPQLVARRAVPLSRLQLEFSPTSGRHEAWNVLRVAPVGAKRFLVLLEHERYRVSPWAHPDRATGEDDGSRVPVRSVTFENDQERLVLALVRKDGRVLALGDEPRAAEPRPVFAAGAQTVPLVLDERDTCPYAILAAGRRALLCYDLELRFLSERRLPLDEIGYPRVTYDGVEYTLWLFGRRYAERPKPPGSYARAARAPAMTPEGFGVRYRPGDGSVEPMPIDRDDLLARLNRVARGPEGERLRLHPAGLAVVPFRDLDTDEPFWVLIEGIAAQRLGSRYQLRGTRVFFRARLDRTGLGTVQQLPFWVVQEDRADPFVDEERGVVSLPTFLREEDLQPYSLGDNDVVLWLQLAFASPDEDGRVPREKGLLQTLAIFRGTDNVPRWVHLDLDPSLKRSWRRRLSTSALEVWPFFLLDRVGRTAFAFAASCEPRRGHEIPCFAVMDLSY